MFEDAVPEPDGPRKSGFGVLISCKFVSDYLWRWIGASGAAGKLKQSVVPDPTHDERRRLSAADLQRLAEAKDWTIATFCGGAAEFDLFGDRRADCGDMRAIDNMLERLQLVWSEDN